MTEEKKETFTRTELGYVNNSNDYYRKCAKCEHRDRKSENCEIMPENDNDVSDGGVCKQFKPGRHVIIDLDAAEEELRKRKLEFYNRRRKRIIQNLRKK